MSDDYIIVCDQCDGYGFIECYNCKGTGCEHYEDDDGYDCVSTCPRCDGKGIIECTKCWGKGKITNKY